MAFRFLEPGRLVDHELELVAPMLAHIDLVMAAVSHPLSLTDARQSRETRRQWEHFFHTAPGGRQPADPAGGLVPSYHFLMQLSKAPGPPWPKWGEGDPPVVIGGGLGLRIGITPDIERHIGNVGYNVYPPARGNHYAERAVRLLMPLAARHGLGALWITCNPDNVASRRTCERLGCELVEIVELPGDHALRLRGEHHKCRYRLVVPG